MNILPPEFLARGERIAGRLEMARRMLGATHRTEPDRRDMGRDVRLAEIKLTIWLEEAGAMTGDDESIETDRWHYRLRDGRLIGLRLEDAARAAWRLSSCTH